MTTIYLDETGDDTARRERLYGGDIFVYAPRASTRALCDFARSMLEDAFSPYDPREAQFHMPVEEFVDRFAPVKPAFIHHPDTKGLIRAVLADLGCDLDETYLDVPRLRGVTSDGYLTAGVGYAHHPHRDTWYSAPLTQLNWWLPIYGFQSESAMAFHPRYFAEGIDNGSREFNYYEWNAVGRKDASKHVKSDSRKQPKARDEIELEPEIRVVCPPGGVVLFAAAHLHSTVPNTSGEARFSMDFRTVNGNDVRAGGGVANVDSTPTGTSLRDFMRCTDLAPFPDNVIAQYDDGSADVGSLVFVPASEDV